MQANIIRVSFLSKMDPQYAREKDEQVKDDSLKKSWITLNLLNYVTLGMGGG